MLPRLMIESHMVEEIMEDRVILDPRMVIEEEEEEGPMEDREDLLTEDLEDRHLTVVATEEEVVAEIILQEVMELEMMIQAIVLKLKETMITQFLLVIFHLIPHREILRISSKVSLI